MKKILIFIFAILTGGLLFASPQRSHAAPQDYKDLPIAISVFGGHVVDGYINSSNESVRLAASSVPVPGYLLDESSVRLSVNGVLVAFTPSIEGGLITYNLGGDLESVFGDSGNLVTIEAKFVMTGDLQGHDPSQEIAEEFNGNIRADFESPVFNLNSPQNGATYNKDVVLDFTAPGQSASELSQAVITTVYIDGQLTTLKSGDIIKTEQGKHNVQTVSVDSAGNQTIVNCEYTFDNSIYFNDATYFDDSIVYLGDKIFIKGWTEAGSKVAVRLTGYDPETIANQDGYFEVMLDSNDIGVGDYGVFVDITDPAGNFYSWSIGHLTIKKMKLAKSASVKQDVVSKASAGEPVDIKIDENLAQKPIQIKTISDEKIGTNWSAWIILLFAVVLASGISTVGYYGYEWLFGGSNAVVNEHITQKPVITKTRSREKEEEKDDSSDHSLRW